jgi:hypothetical protein
MSFGRFSKRRTAVTVHPTVNGRRRPRRIRQCTNFQMVQLGKENQNGICCRFVQH